MRNQMAGFTRNTADISEIAIGCNNVCSETEINACDEQELPFYHHILWHRWIRKTPCRRMAGQMNIQNHPLNPSNRPAFSALFLASLMVAESLTAEAGGTVALLMTRHFRTNLRIAKGAAALVERDLVPPNLTNSAPV